MEGDDEVINLTADLYGTDGKHASSIEYYDGEHDADLRVFIDAIAGALRTLCRMSRTAAAYCDIIDAPPLSAHGQATLTDPGPGQPIPLPLAEIGTMLIWRVQGRAKTGEQVALNLLDGRATHETASGEAEDLPDIGANILAHLQHATTRLQALIAPAKITTLRVYWDIEPRSAHETAAALNIVDSTKPV